MAVAGMTTVIWLRCRYLQRRYFMIIFQHLCAHDKLHLLFIFSYGCHEKAVHTPKKLKEKKSQFENVPRLPLSAG